MIFSFKKLNLALKLFSYNFVLLKFICYFSANYSKFIDQIHFCTNNYRFLLHIEQLFAFFPFIQPFDISFPNLIIITISQSFFLKYDFQLIFLIHFPSSSWLFLDFFKLKLILSQNQRKKNCTNGFSLIICSSAKINQLIFIIS